MKKFETREQFCNRIVSEFMVEQADKTGEDIQLNDGPELNAQFLCEESKMYTALLDSLGVSLIE